MLSRYRRPLLALRHLLPTPVPTLSPARQRRSSTAGSLLLTPVLMRSLEPPPHSATPTWLLQAQAVTRSLEQRQRCAMLGFSRQPPARTRSPGLPRQSCTHGRLPLLLVPILSPAQTPRSATPT